MIRAVAVVVAFLLCGIALVAVAMSIPSENGEHSTPPGITVDIDRAKPRKTLKPPAPAPVRKPAKR